MSQVGYADNPGAPKHRAAQCRACVGRPLDEADQDGARTGSPALAGIQTSQRRPQKEPAVVSVMSKTPSGLRRADRVTGASSEGQLVGRRRHCVSWTSPKKEVGGIKAGYFISTHRP